VEGQLNVAPNVTAQHSGAAGKGKRSGVKPERGPRAPGAAGGAAAASIFLSKPTLRGRSSQQLGLVQQVGRRPTCSWGQQPGPRLALATSGMARPTTPIGSRALLGLM
jgi:hypothetical protein